MRSWTFVAGLSLALALGACHGLPQNQRAATRLTCPATAGDLTRVGAAADGKSCAYRSARGAEVSLRLTPIKGDAQATLAAIEQEVRAMRPPQPPAAEQPNSASEADNEDVDLDMPGLHISTRGHDADVRVAGVRVAARGGDAVVRWSQDVRLRGEATSLERRGVRALFILAGPEGADQTSVGYQAAGPKTGPLTVALVKWGAKDDRNLYEDVRRLVRRNGGA